MRRVASKLLVVGIIIAAVIFLDMKLDLFPAFAKSEGVTAVESSNQLTQLEGAMAKEFKARSDRFSVSYAGDKQELSNQLPAIIRTSLSYDDYSAYVLESYIYTIRSWGNKSTISFEARYRESLEQTAVVDREIKKALAAIIEAGMNDHEKIKAVHDWIVTHVEYDQTLSHYTAYDAVTLGEAVCQGYSLLGYRMLKEVGIPVRIAEGTVNTGEHAWNMVQLDGVWYHLDLTWDDPVASTAGSKVQSAPASNSANDTIRYNYYLRTDEELRTDHKWTKTYPTANVSYADTIRKLEKTGTSSERDRFTKLKLSLGLHWLEPEYTVTSPEQLKQMIKSALDSRTTSLEFRYEQGDQFATALKAAFQGSKIAVGYKASYEPYAGDTSLLVRIQLQYQ